MPIFQGIFATSAFLMLTTASQLSIAQSETTYPSKSIRIIVASAPSGGIDQSTRIISKHLADALGQSVVIDNRPGASGDIGVGLAAKSPPDGYTLTMISANHAVNPSVTKNQPYDLLRDLTAITRIISPPYLLVMNRDVPAASLAEFLALARSRKGGLSYASGGTGSLTHLAGALLGSMTNVPLVHIPYKGGGPALVGVMAGEAQIQFSDLVTSGPHVRSGRVRALAISSVTRSKAFPDTPSLNESGVKGFEVTQWYGMVAPTKTPKQVISKMNGEVLRILRLPEVVDQFAQIGANPTGTNPEEFNAFIRSEMEKWGRVVKTVGIRPD